MKRCRNPKCGLTNSDLAEVCKSCGSQNLVYEPEPVKVSRPATLFDGTTTPQPVVPAGGGAGAGGSDHRPWLRRPGGANDGRPGSSAPPHSGGWAPSHNSVTGNKSMLGRLQRDTRYLLIGILVSFIVGFLFMLIPYLYQHWDSYPRPAVVWIEGLDSTSPEMNEGERKKLTARLADSHLMPDRFIWSPSDMIDGNGQSVYLVPTSPSRRTQPYPIEVSVIAKDRYGNDCPTVKPITVTVVPKQVANRLPEFDGDVQVEGKLEVPAGGEVKLHAKVNDPDKDEIRYNWTVQSDAIRVKENGKSVAVLEIPPDFTRNTIQVQGSLTASDENGSASKPFAFYVTPKLSARRPRGGGGTRAQVYVITVQPPKGGAAPAPGASPPPAPAPAQKSQEPAPAAAPPRASGSPGAPEKPL
jgi:hypothetical protein